MAQIKWTTDIAHTQVQFKVRHMMISTVTGEFKDFDIEVTTDGLDFSTAKASFSAPLEAIETKNKQREEHLKTSDFFDAANHPEITFESSGVEKTGEDAYDLKGDLTIRGVTKPVVLNVEQGGIIKEANGKHRAGFEISGKIKRKEFGLQYNALTESGGMVVGDEVRIFINLELLEE